MRMYDAMLAHFGPRAWWPSKAGVETAAGKVEVCAGAILTQNTNWKNVEKAIASLRAADGLSIAALHAMRVSKLARLIRSAGYFNVKARRLKSFVGAVVEQADGDIERFLSSPKGKLRERLLAISGVGPETADSMILYAAGKASFVIDAYTMRIFRRHGLLAESARYDDAKGMFEAALPAEAEIYNDYHAQIVSVGKEFCRKRARCEGCPLEGFSHDATVV